MFLIAVIYELFCDIGRVLTCAVALYREGGMSYVPVKFNSGFLNEILFKPQGRVEVSKDILEFLVIFSK